MSYLQIPPGDPCSTGVAAVIGAPRCPGRYNPTVTPIVTIPTAAAVSVVPQGQQPILRVVRNINKPLVAHTSTITIPAVIHQSLPTIHPITPTIAHSKPATSILASTSMNNINSCNQQQQLTVLQRLEIHHLRKELVLANAQNKRLQEQLNMKNLLSNSAQQDNKVFKDTIEALEVQNQSQAREIKKLVEQLQNRRRLASFPLPGAKANSIEKEILALPPSPPPITALRESMIRNKNGCPLCLTSDHTLLTCGMLRPSGYLVTYHKTLDAQFNTTMKESTTIAATTGDCNGANETYDRHSQCISKHMAPQRETDPNKIVDGQGDTEVVPKTSPAKAQEVIELLSDSEDSQEWNQENSNLEENNAMATATSAIDYDGESGQSDDSVKDSGDKISRSNVQADTPISGNLQLLPQQNPKTIDKDCDGIGNEDRPITIDTIEKDEPQEETELQLLDTDLQMQQTEPQLEQEGIYGERIGDEEIKIIGETGKNPLSEYAHARFDCVTKPFADDPSAFCSNCYCYVCDVKAADCKRWKLSGESEDEKESHCYAESTILKWKRRRSRLRNIRKRPERALKNIAMFLPDMAPMPKPHPTKRKTRSGALYECSDSYDHQPTAINTRRSLRSHQRQKTRSRPNDS